MLPAQAGQRRGVARRIRGDLRGGAQPGRNCQGRAIEKIATGNLAHDANVAGRAGPVAGSVAPSSPTLSSEERSQTGACPLRELDALDHTASRSFTAPSRSTETSWDTPR